MRILFVNPYFKPYLGGIERIIERLAPELQRIHDVEAVGLVTTRAFFPDRWMHDLPAHETIDGLEIYRCRFIPSRIPRVFHAALAGYIAPDLPRVIRSFRPDVVHYTYGEWWGANLFTHMLTRQSAHVLTPFFHDIPRIRTTMPLYFVNRRLVPRMEAVHVLSEVEKLQVAQAYGVNPLHIHVIPPGVDLPEQRTHIASDRNITVLAVGRLNEHKGQRRLARMLERVSGETGIAMRLVLAGDDAGDGHALRRMAAHPSGRLRIDIRGHCSDMELAGLYEQADIFALPSLYESFGLVYIEAMAHGLPVVAYDVGPVRAVLEAGAMVVTRDDENAFQAAIVQLARDPQYRLRLGAEGEAFVRENFSWSRMAGRLHALYRDSIRRRVSAAGAS